MYSTLFPEDWRNFFHEHDLYDILDLVLTDDLTPFQSPNGAGWKTQEEGETWKRWATTAFIIARLHPRHSPTQSPPRLYLHRPQKHQRNPPASGHCMKDKKLHEVEHFSKYVDSFTTSVSEIRNEPITHIADFESGTELFGEDVGAFV